MKILISNFLIVFGFVFASAQTTEQKKPQLSSAAQEANKLSVEVVRLFEQKKFEEALPLAQKVITIREDELGKTHLSVGQAYRNLAYIQLQTGRRKEAENSFENAFDIYEKNQPLTGADEKVFPDLLEIVAINQAIGGNFSKGEKKLQRAVELREKLNGTDALETSNSLTKLADLYQAKGDYEKAAPLLVRALDIKVKKVGVKNDNTRDAFQSLWCAFTKLGRDGELTEIENKYLLPNPASRTPNVKVGVINGKAVRLVTPPYPAEAKEKRVSGQVEVMVTIDETGQVTRACAVKGAKELQRASEIAAYQSKFTPTLLGGKTVRVTGKIIYNFIVQ